MSHPGIELRITTPAGVIVQCDSDFAHYSTLFRGVPLGEWITLIRQLEGSPLIDDQDLAAAAFAGQVMPTLTIEIRAVELADVEAPDDASELLDDRCCACGSAQVVYHNYRDQPFCGPCANGDGAARTSSGGAVEGQDAPGAGGEGRPGADGALARSRYSRRLRLAGRWWRDRT